MIKSFFIETLGCQMNKSDAELMTLSLKNEGFKEVHSPDKAEILIFNTCSVRQHAENRAIARVLNSRKKIQERMGIIIITGCMAQRMGEELIDKKLADLIIGPYESPNIGKIVRMHLNSDLLLESESNSSHRTYMSLEKESFSERIVSGLENIKSQLPFHKFVTITHGCENYCSYCIVPYVRGKLISFNSNTILDYINTLVSTGINEITLLGQNVNQYGIDINDIPFYKLLEKTAKIDNLIRINFITSHPMDFSPEIIDVIRDYKNISRSVHIPLQSGSDKILKMMNRKYSMKDYNKIIEIIDANLSDYSITTDLIVGFPGETEDDFIRTLKAVENIRFDEAYTYAYSPREGTPAFNLNEELSREQKIERLNKLIEIQRSISKEKLLSRIDNIEVLIPERISKKNKHEIMGRTFLQHPAVIPGSVDDIGKKIRIKINNVKGSTLSGIPIE